MLRDSGSSKGLNDEACWRVSATTGHNSALVSERGSQARRSQPGVTGCDRIEKLRRSQPCKPKRRPLYHLYEVSRNRALWCSCFLFANEILYFFYEIYYGDRIGGDCIFKKIKLCVIRIKSILSFYYFYFQA